MTGSAASAGYEVAVVPPFDLALTVAALRRRPANLVECFVSREYLRLVRVGGRLRLFGVRQVASDVVRLRVLDGALSADERAEATAVFDRILGLSVDVSGAWALVRRDARLVRLADGLDGLKPPCFPDLWTTLLNVIPYQQVSLDAGMAVSNRLTARYGEARSVAGVRVYAHPTPAQILALAVEDIRACGFSAAKTRTLRGVAQAAVDGLLRDSEFAALANGPALARLESLPGIGPWSAQLVLLRGLGRLSVFPPGDSGAARNLRTFLNVTEDAAVRQTLDELSTYLGAYRGLLYFLLLGQRLRMRGEVPGS